jgi:hypothetical protein
VNVDQDGSKVTDRASSARAILVTENQELARLSAPPQHAGPAGNGQAAGSCSLKAPAAGSSPKCAPSAGAPASPQAGPMFRIADQQRDRAGRARCPVSSILKLNPGATVRISRDDDAPT